VLFDKARRKGGDSIPLHAVFAQRESVENISFNGRVCFFFTTEE
jgi:hypothetical protein